MPRSPESIAEHPKSDERYPQIVHSIHASIEHTFPGVISISEVDRRFRELGQRSRVKDFVGIFVERGIKEDLRDQSGS